MSYTDYRVPLLSGAAAGISVDVSLFPLDTIKTRLQSQQGFLKSGGFRGIYSGLLSVSVGSGPTAALFFITYESTKNIAAKYGAYNSPLVHMMAASFGEVAACLIRVPVEVIKQRAQAYPEHSSITAFKNTLNSEGLRGLYRGYITTVIREVPFSLLQFPLWEYFKILWSGKQGRPVDPWQSSLCGALAGAIASGLTAPIDVAKTRIMLAEKDSELAAGHIRQALQVVYAEKGVRGLFAGILPRVIWISVGGAIFLGVYDKVKVICNQYLLHNDNL